jgi:XTP/dITP diphosphohydrolase
VRKLLVASGNRGKLAEISRILDGCVEKIYSLADFSDIPAPLEDGDTFEANARKKAMIAALATGIPALADDSGLVVDALDGRPGIFSARFAGEGSSDAENNAKLLRELTDVVGEDRTAAFHCVVALCFPDGSSRVFHGELKGIVLERSRGAGGFGYDPLFLVPAHGKTLAELEMDIKNEISHRGKALKCLREYLSQV